MLGPRGTFPQSSNWKLFLSRHRPAPAPGYTGQGRSGGWGEKIYCKQLLSRKKSGHYILKEFCRTMAIGLDTQFTVYAIIKNKKLVSQNSFSFS